MKLNNKGYMIIEIVLASMIAFGIAYFLFDLTVNMKNKNDDIQANAIILADRGIIENYIMKQLNNSDNTNVGCNAVGSGVSFKDKEGKSNLITLNEDRKLVHSRESSGMTNGDEIVFSKDINQYVTITTTDSTGRNPLKCETSPYGNYDVITITMTMKDKITDNEYPIELKYIKKRN